MTTVSLRLFLPAVLAGLLLASTTAAGATIRADVTATSIQASEATHLSGPLVAFLQEQGRGVEGASPAFRLEAPDLFMETDAADPTIRSSLVDHQVNTSTTPESFTNGAVAGLQLREGYRWNLFSMDPARPASIEVSGTCATAEPSSIDSITRGPWAASTTRPLTSRDAASALAWSCVGGSFVRVTGDFMLSLWNIDAMLTADGTTRELRTGPQQSGYAPGGAPDLSSALSRHVEVYLFATNGTLTVPSLTGTSFTLYTGDATTLAAPALTLQGSKGALSVQGREVALSGSAVKLTGQAESTLTGRGVGQPFAARVDGSVDGVAVDGRALAFTTSSDATSVPVWTYLAVALLLVFAVLLYRYVRPVRAYNRFVRHEESGGFTAPATWRERRGAGYWVLGQQSILEGFPARALRQLARSERLFPRSVDPGMIRAFAVERLGRLEEALDIHKQTFAALSEQSERARIACHVARLLVKLGRLPEAVEWLKTAVGADVQVFEAEVHDRAYDPLLSDPWFANVRAGYVSRAIVQRGSYDASFV